MYSLAFLRNNFIFSYSTSGKVGCFSPWHKSRTDTCDPRRIWRQWAKQFSEYPPRCTYRIPPSLLHRSSINRAFSATLAVFSSGKRRDGRLRFVIIAWNRFFINASVLPCAKERNCDTIIRGNVKGGKRG